MRVGVVGFGAVGGLVASLVAAHAETHLFARGLRGAHAMAHGLRLEGLEDLDVEPNAIHVHLAEHPLENSLSLDAMLFAVKAHQVPDTLAEIDQHLAPNGLVSYLGNGLGVVETLARHYPKRTLASSCTHGAMTGAASTTVWTGRGALQIGAWGDNEAPEGTKDLVALLDLAGLQPSVVDDAQGMLWSKALLNVAINPICALAGVENGAMLERTDLFEAGLGLLREAMRVGDALGVHLPSDEDIATRLVDVLLATSGNRCSMLEDFRCGRRSEIDALNGAIVDYGASVGCPTPLNAQITGMVRAVDADHR